MNKRLHDILTCPYDKDEKLSLNVFMEQDEKIIEGIMECPVCSRYFPIVYGIPFMSPDEFRDASLEADLLEKWKRFLGNRFGKGQGFKLPKEIKK